MRSHLLAPALLLALAACTGDHAVVRGSLLDADGRDSLRAWVVGGPEAVPVAPGEPFEISRVPPGPVDLRLADADGEVARLRIAHLPAGATLSLEGIGLGEDGVAFPSAVRMEGVDTVTVNGIRIADPAALPEAVEALGSVLAMSEDADALLLRPRADTLPDLPVVITPGTQWVRPDGEPASPVRLDHGDSVRVAGPSGAGYVYAERLVVYPRAADEEEPTRSGPRDRNPVERVWDWITGRDGRSGEDEGEERERREPRPDRERRAERDRDAERAEIPPGHRPPPGMCRDWDPDLPPGRQPPPYEC